MKKENQAGLEALRMQDAMLEKIGEQALDIRFLLDRAARAGLVELGESSRETGLSSHSVVAIAYGALPLDEQIFPSDQSDLDACVRAFERLPVHRKTREAQEAVFRATQYIAVKAREFGGRS